MQALKSLSSDPLDAHHSQMLNQIPTHMIGGPLGAGKTSLIRSLMKQKPADERWAVLINEFGQIGLDAALLSTDETGISLAEVAGGCLCCVNGVPFQVGLSRLLRKAQPDRLLIEPSGLGHPAELLSQLEAPPWRGVLALRPSVTVLDAAALARGEPLPVSQQQALPHSGLLLLNKSEGLLQADRKRIVAQLPPLPLRWTQQGELPINELPGLASQTGLDLLQLPLPTSANPALGGVWLDPTQPFCQSQGNDDGWSIGWRWHPSQRFDLQRIAQNLDSLGWQRAKLIMQGAEGWRSANALAGDTLAFKPSEWRKDSRLELIFNEPQDEQALAAAIRVCRL
jgi:G3E family GTPase